MSLLDMTDFNRTIGGGRANEQLETSSSNEPPPIGIKSLHDPEEAVADIVFVHGLQGHREKTWSAKNATQPWPKQLLPSEIPNARVLTFGYDASVFGQIVSKNCVHDHANNLLSQLAGFREKDSTDTRPIIFVCHCLGGLVSMAALAKSHGRYEKHIEKISRHTRGIIFMGTPHRGSVWGPWAEGLARSVGMFKQANTDILKVLRKDSEILNLIQDDFHNLLRVRNRTGEDNIEVACFYEELFYKPVGAVWIAVEKESAILPGYVPIGIYADHKGMTRFANSDDQGFQDVCGQIRRWIKRLIPSGSATGGGLRGIEDSLAQCGQTTLHRQCRIPGANDERADVSELVKTWLGDRSHGRWLMILDNADDIEVLVGQQTDPLSSSRQDDADGRYIPDCAHGSLMVTTRKRSG